MPHISSITRRVFALFWDTVFIVTVVSAEMWSNFMQLYLEPDL